MSQISQLTKIMTYIKNARKISGWMTDNELSFIAEIASHAKISIEVGSYYGRSCRAMADNTDGIVYAVDPYKGHYQTMNPNIYLDFDDETLEVFKYNLSDHIYSGKVIHFRGVFTEFTPNDPADFVFIDGDHSYEAVLADIQHALKIVHKDAIIAGHDYGTEGFQGVEKAVFEVFSDKINTIETIWYIQI